MEKENVFIKKVDYLDRLTPLGAFISTLYRNSQKEKLKTINTKLKKIISKPNDIVIIHSDERGSNLIETIKTLKETIKEALTSLNTDKDGFKWIQFDNGHFFGLCIHQNKIILFDSSNAVMTNTIKNILNNKLTQQELEITDFKFVDLNQQMDYTSCPTFTSYNIKKLKKAFSKNPKLFNELFDINKVDENGTVIDKTLYKEFDIIPSIQRKWLFNEVNGFNTMKQMFSDKGKKIIVDNQDETMENYGIKKDGDMILEQNFYNFINNYIPLKQEKSIQLLTGNTEYLLSELDIYNYLGLEFDKILQEIEKPVYKFGKFN